jgi:LytS/YehU family sensor histidine kinase
MPSNTDFGRITRNIVLGWLCVALSRSCYVAIVMGQYDLLSLTRPLIMQMPWILMTPGIVWIAMKSMAAPAEARTKWLVAHLTAMVVVAFAAAAWTYLAWTITIGEQPGDFLTWIGGQLNGLTFNYAAIAGVAVGAVLFQNYRNAKARQVILETDLFTARLHGLMLQLQPHFLFNTLNAVAELVHRNRTSALTALANLKALLERSVNRALASRVHVSEELKALEAYVDIERMRFGAALTVNISADEAAQAAPIPPFLLQPLVENAIRHGVQRQGGGVISVSARRQQDNLVLEVSDDGAGLGEYGGTNEGIGLGLTRRRLDELFGPSYSMALMGREEGGTVVRLVLPTEDHQLRPVTPPPRVAPPEARQSAGITLAIFAAWTVFGLLGGVAEVAREVRVAMPVTGTGVYLRHILDGWLWAALTIMLFSLVRRATWWGFSAPAFLILHLSFFLITLLARVHFGLAMGLQPLPEDGLPRLSMLLWNVYAYTFTAAITHAWIQRERSRFQGRVVDKLERKMAEASFDELRWNVDPQFMIGTLDHIADLAKRDPRAADEAIEDLSQVLRRMLAANREQERTLGEEISLLRSRWKLQASGSPVAEPHVNIGNGLSGLKLPSLLLSALLVLILPPRARGLALRIDARRRDDILDLEISLHGSNGTRPPREGNTEELLKLQQWLALKFGSRAECRVQTLGDGLAARAAIPLSSVLQSANA